MTESGESPFYSEEQLGRTVYSRDVHRLLYQAKVLQLKPTIHYTIGVYTTRDTEEKIQVLELTKLGIEEREKKRAKLFSPDLPHYRVPLGKDFDISLLQDSIVTMDGLLGLWTLRQRYGANVCEFTDDRKRLEQKEFQARVLKINPERKIAKLLFNGNDPEQLHQKYVKEKDGMPYINPPIRIGPVCVVPLQFLYDGKFSDSLSQWVKNIVRRNNPFSQKKSRR